MKKDLKQIALGCLLGLVAVLGVAQIGPTPPIISGGGGGVVNNITVLSNVNIATFTNVTVYDSLTINTNLTVNNNVTVNQNISVSGKGTFNNIIITNSMLFSTNAFPLSAGTTWSLARPYQLIITNADFTIGALGGMSNNLLNWGALVFSNSAATAKFCDMTALAVTPIGPNSTNKLYVPAGKVGVISINSWGIGVMTNLVTALQP